MFSEPGLSPCQGLKRFPVSRHVKPFIQLDKRDPNSHMGDFAAEDMLGGVAV